MGVFRTVRDIVKYQELVWFEEVRQSQGLARLQDMVARRYLANESDRLAIEEYFNKLAQYFGRTAINPWADFMRIRSIVAFPKKEQSPWIDFAEEGNGFFDEDLFWGEAYRPESAEPLIVSPDRRLIVLEFESRGRTETPSPSGSGGPLESVMVISDARLNPLRSVTLENRIESVRLSERKNTSMRMVADLERAFQVTNISGLRQDFHEIRRFIQGNDPLEAARLLRRLQLGVHRDRVGSDRTAELSQQISELMRTLRAFRSGSNRNVQPLALTYTPAPAPSRSPTALPVGLKIRSVKTDSGEETDS
jgi:hypothetical protein